MFNYHDGPIISCEDDIIGIKRYSEKFGEAISNWKKKESLVITLNGKWGSGKTSIINCAVEHIENNIEDKPTIIRFNSWEFSNQNKITEHFFNEISKNLKLKKK
ncbi:MAG: KAP family NTPase [Candidatus Cloacimonetes bacterium]|nr:KAP family NTPase [Candidatus Cloacimonadota bacterium]